MISIVWFRRDLRMADNPALCRAAESSGQVIPFFCFDDALLHGRHACGNRTAFLLESLQDLQGQLGALGGDLVIRYGRPAEELGRLAAETGAERIYAQGEVTPYGRRRDQEVVEALSGRAEVIFAPGLLAADALDIMTNQGSPFTVFTPFYRKWREVKRRPVEAPPRNLRLPAGLVAGSIPALEELALESQASHRQIGGRSKGRERLDAFMREDVRGYDSNHDALGLDKTSRLSPYLHLGCLSALEVERAAPDGEGAEAFRRQLAWRDFYHYVLWHFPENATQEFQKRYRSLKWNYDQTLFEKWQQGQTGFPLVDAGMRQLLQEGWMHNRARLVVGSFLTKDLGIDWRWGERYFMNLLIDGDEANNNGNWQWIASVGVDPQPAYRRTYNPELQHRRYDPQSVYVRRYVPELARVPDRYIFTPSQMPEAVQRESGCIIGRDYPAPIVDHKAAREAALGRYRV